ncbi:PadR family transcriptional regulator [Herbiconiux moechotypicola]|uniref:Transcription regulator PadR N-terminal domain-containing protein n=1 Tax=Herbiconiux moechotypicola TaxID=637393 RepID=A0ABN3DNZ5_9MICO|nr:PadR family transcriptional regulator [Herbiconiux moechotypicola]MCS5730446.1 PadR family transcriptional regulator [Herbiconiux moechotypicola]
MRRIDNDTQHSHIPFPHTDPRDRVRGWERGPRGHGHGGGFGPGFGGPGFGGFGPGFGPRGPQRASRGDVRAAILSLLAESRSNGYGLIKAIAEKTGGVWRPSPGSVYPTLQQLVDEELIFAEGDGRRTEFDLTESGRAYVAEHAEELEQAWQSAAGTSPVDAEFHASVAKLLGVVKQFRVAATDEQRTQATAKIDEARRALYLILAD